MFPRFQRDYHRFFLSLIVNRTVKQKRISEYLGSLGSIAAIEPTVFERLRFWQGFDARLDAIRIKHPGRVTPADADHVRALVAKRIPLPCGEDLSKAVLLRDAVDALAALGDGEDVMALVDRLAAAARQLRQARQLAQAKEPAE